MGRTLLRDAVVEHLGCSQLAGEQIIDTMVGRGFLAQERLESGLVIWRFRDAGAAPWALDETPPNPAESKSTSGRGSGTPDALDTSAAGNTDIQAAAGSRRQRGSHR
jgi:hypothetical protein